jgi:hypothetical protein
MSTQDFYFLMQRAAEEANLMTLDEHFDNWIPTVRAPTHPLRLLA